MSHERHIIIFIQSAHHFYLKVLFQSQLDLLSKFDFYENRYFESRQRGGLIKRHVGTSDRYCVNCALLGSEEFNVCS